MGGVVVAGGFPRSGRVGEGDVADVVDEQVPPALAGPGRQRPGGALPPEPRQGWRNLFVDDICDITLADPAAGWETADNYNASHPFNSIDQLSIAVT